MGNPYKSIPVYASTRLKAIEQNIYPYSPEIHISSHVYSAHLYIYKSAKPPVQNTTPQRIALSSQYNVTLNL